MAELTSEGFIARSLEQIISEMEGNLKATFGNSFDTSPESPDGQLIGIFAEQVWQAEQAAQAVYQSSDPDIAIDSQLEYVCDYNGVYRQLATFTKTSVLFSGAAGTRVPKGMIVGTEDGVEFTVDSESSIVSDVSVTCTKSGRVVVNAGEITKIKTPVSGVTGVTNTSSASTGLERETNAQLRNRRAFSTIAQGTNTRESIYADLKKLGAEFVSISSNETDVVVGDLPPHSFRTVVVGLSDEEIANSIYSNKPEGIPTFGSVEKTVLDSKGYPNLIRFSRPTDTLVDVNISVKVIKGASSDAIDGITRNVQDHINKVSGIGSTVIWSDVFGAAIIGAASMGGTSSITVCTIGRQGSAQGTTDLPMSQVEKARAGVITVTEV